MGIVLSIIDFIIATVVNIALFAVEILLFPIRLLARCLGAGHTTYWGRGWTNPWRRRVYFGPAI